MEPNLTTLLGSLKGYLDLPVAHMRTMEPGHYTSKAFFDLEVETIWKKEWINVGHVSEIRNPGDFFTVELIGEPLMIVRGQPICGRRRSAKRRLHRSANQWEAPESR